MPTADLEGDFRLGPWVVNQRHSYRENTLDPERAERLASLPGWIWDTRVAAWEKRFTQLRRFVEREGHARVTLDYEEEGFRLGIWVSTQRRSYRWNTLDPERVKRREALPGWTWG